MKAHPWGESRRASLASCTGFESRARCPLICSVAEEAKAQAMMQIEILLVTRGAPLELAEAIK